MVCWWEGRDRLELQRALKSQTLAVPFHQVPVDASLAHRAPQLAEQCLHHSHPKAASSQRQQNKSPFHLHAHLAGGTPCLDP